MITKTVIEIADTSHPFADNSSCYEELGTVEITLEGKTIGAENIAWNSYTSEAAAKEAFDAATSLAFESSFLSSNQFTLNP